MAIKKKEKIRINNKKSHKIIWGFFMKNIFKVVFVIIGTLIGAGFASGQEIYIFFFSHGIKGIVGILISSILMGFVIYKTLIILNKNNINTYKDFLDVLIISKGKNKEFNIKNIINLVINIFILVTFFIMIAGFGAYFEQEFGINSLIGSFILSIMCYLVFKTSIKGVVKANEVIVPVLIIFLIIIGFNILIKTNLLEIQKYIIENNSSNYIIDAILYCSYNSILLIPVLLTLKKYITTKRQIVNISIISMIISIVLSIIIFLLLTKVDVDITKIEMPAVYVVSNMFKLLKNVYGFIILGSIFTTSISLGNSFLQNVSKNDKNYTQIAIIMCVTAVIVSKIGFSNLINLIYPIFGYLGLVQIFGIIIKTNKKNFN